MMTNEKGNKMKVFEVEIQVTSGPPKNQTTTQQDLELLEMSIVYIGLATILALLIIFCVALVAIRKWKLKYYNCITKNRNGCDKNCPGIRRPLLRQDKLAESDSQTDVSSRKD